MNVSWRSTSSCSNMSDKMARNWRKVFKGLQFPKRLCPEELIKVKLPHFCVKNLLLSALVRYRPRNNIGSAKEL
jgi:hypothetical protein